MLNLQAPKTKMLKKYEKMKFGWILAILRQSKYIESIRIKISWKDFHSECGKKNTQKLHFDFEYHKEILNV